MIDSTVSFEWEPYHVVHDSTDGHALRVDVHPSDLHAMDSSCIKFRRDIADGPANVVASLSRY